MTFEQAMQTATAEILSDPTAVAYYGKKNTPGYRAGRPEHPFDINCGFCEEWANRVVELVPEAEAVGVGNLTGNPEDDLEYPHVFVLYRGRVFDAETPQGAVSWKNLPAFQGRRREDVVEHVVFASKLLESGQSCVMKFSEEAKQAIWDDMWFGWDDFPYESMGMDYLLSTLDERERILLWHRYEKRSTFSAAGAHVRSLRTPDRCLDTRGAGDVVRQVLRRLRTRYELADRRPGDVQESLSSHEVVDHLLEYGKIDYGVDELGRTRWNMPAQKLNYECYWILPNGTVQWVPAHQKWARENVLKDPDAEQVLSRMKALGYVRATVDQNVFYCNTADLNPKQEAAVTAFTEQHRLSLTHAVVA